MTTQKQIATSIKSLINGSTFDRVLDRASNIDDITATLKEHWTYDLDNRKPGMALTENGEIPTTDLDLACLLGTLAQRKALVILPKYASAAPTTSPSSKATNGVVLSADNRRGQIVRLSSNKEYFSFNMLVIDQNVMNTANGGSLGAPRYFMVVGKDGRWHPGWESIQFIPDAAENAFLKKFDLATQGAAAFKQFVHPQRWTSFFGQYFFLSKVVIDRLEQEAKELRASVKKLTPPKDAGAGGAPAWEKDTSDDSFSKSYMRVPVMEVEVDAPFRGDFVEPLCSNLEQMKARLKAIDNDELPALRFATRATELAFYKNRGEQGGFPSWIRGAKWDEHLIKRTSWRRLVYAQLAVGQPGVALRYRIRAKDVEVAAK